MEGRGTSPIPLLRVKWSQNKVWFSPAAQPPVVSLICPMFNKQPCPPANIHINADSQLKWLQIKAESVIIERVLSWMTIKRHLIRGLPKRSSTTTISMHSVMDIMDNYPECTTQPHSCLQLHPQQLPPRLHPLSSPVTSSYSFPWELVVSS